MLPVLGIFDMGTLVVEVPSRQIKLNKEQISIARLAQSVERETLKMGQSQGCGFDPRIGLMEKDFFFPQQLPSYNLHNLVPCWLNPEGE